MANSAGVLTGAASLTNSMRVRSSPVYACCLSKRKNLGPVARWWCFVVLHHGPQSCKAAAHLVHACEPPVHCDVCHDSQVPSHGPDSPHTYTHVHEDGPNYNTCKHRAVLSAPCIVLLALHTHAQAHPPPTSPIHGMRPIQPVVGLPHIRLLQPQIKDKDLKMHATTVCVDINITDARLHQSTQHMGLGSKFSFLLPSRTPCRKENLLPSLAYMGKAGAAELAHQSRNKGLNLPSCRVSFALKYCCPETVFSSTVPQLA